MEVQFQEWDCDSFVKTRQEGSEEWPKWNCSETSGDFELNVLTFIHLAFFRKDCLDFHEEMERERDVRLRSRGNRMNTNWTVLSSPQ